MAIVSVAFRCCLQVSCSIPVEEIVNISEQAGKAIMQIYNSAVSITGASYTKQPAAPQCKLFLSAICLPAACSLA